MIWLHPLDDIVLYCPLICPASFDLRLVISLLTFHVHFFLGGGGVGCVTKAPALYVLPPPLLWCSFKCHLELGSLGL